MQRFLERLSKHIINHHQNSLKDLSIILPNQRAGLFLKRYLSNELKKTFWSPKIISIEEFICDISGFQIANNLDLIFSLYKIYTAQRDYVPQTFDQFIEWAPLLIKDFNDIDQYLVEPDQIFRYLDDIKVIEAWNPSDIPTSALQDNYLGFYRSLLDIYNDFCRYLISEKSGYQGLVYRFTAENIDDLSIDKENKRFIFAGFNALSKSEVIILEWFIKNSSSEIFWDADSYYVKSNDPDSSQQEAGLFLRKHLNNKTFTNKGVKWIDNDFETGTKQIQILGVNGLVNQAKTAAQILSESLANNDRQEEIAVVLADEQLVIPVLNALPEKLKYLNVTMGIPLSQTPYFDWIIRIIDLYINANRYKSLHKKSGLQFRIQDILVILKHAVLHRIDCTTLQSRQTGNKVFYSASELQEHFSPNNQICPELESILIENKLENGKELHTLLTKLLDFLISAEKGETEASKLNKEYLYQFSLVFNQLNRTLDAHNSELSLRAYKRIFEIVVRGYSLSLYGEPLKGIQLMGMLETRTLDFKEVILLSMNEGIIPETKSYSSFVPFDVKRKFEMPTYKERNAIFAFHYYRLIQRAEKISLIYNSDNDRLGGGEKSRFILQTELELARYNPNISITHQSVNFPDQFDLHKDLSIRKDENIHNTITKLFKRGVSPSLINTFRRCPLQFYLNYVARIKEDQHDDKGVDEALLGTIVHEVLEQVYTPYIGTSLNHKDLQAATKKISSYCEAAFEKHYPLGHIDSGRNHLVFRSAESVIRNFLQSEIKILKSNSIHLIGLEQDLSFNLNSNLKIKGKIDRIDRINNTIRIIDYKSGKVQPNEVKLKSFEEINDEKKYDKIIQLLIYQWLYSKNNPTLYTEEYQSGLVSLINLSRGFMPLITPEETNPIQETENLLLSISERISDLNSTYEQTEELNTCEYCAYRLICNR